MPPKAQAPRPDSCGHPPTLMRYLLAFKDEGRLALVGRAFEFFVSTLLGHPDGGQVFWAYQTHRPRRFEVGDPPSDGSSNRLSRKPFPVSPGGERPTDFRRAFEGGLDLPLEVGEPHLTDKSPGGPIADDPITKPHYRPMPDVAQ